MIALKKQLYSLRKKSYKTASIEGIAIIMNSLLYRLLDFIAAFSGLVITSPILLVIVIVGFFDTGSPVFTQKRVGKHKKPFILIKFRTMSVDTKAVASHLASTASITKIGGVLRKTKIDELPQLINVLKGEMSLVGPRPCLFNQEELIEERNSRGVFEVLPGITGLAQVNDIDMSTPKRLAEWDQRMIKGFSFADYFRYILMTATGKGSGDRIS